MTKVAEVLADGTEEGRQWLRCPVKAVTSRMQTLAELIGDVRMP